MWTGFWRGLRDQRDNANDETQAWRPHRHYYDPDPAMVRYCTRELVVSLILLAAHFASEIITFSTSLAAFYLRKVLA
jgi:hypothetical protein